MKLLKKLLCISCAATAAYGFAEVTASRHLESESIDHDNPYLTEGKSSKVLKERKPGMYEAAIKPALDKALAFMGLIILSPLFAVVGIAIFVDDPGPVFFTQKRVGKGKHFFNLHKFRTMKMSTPHDVPTHMLENPEQYITRVGKFLRKASIDEIPQCWDIFRGKMAIVSPRPALWNQDDLVKERDRYGVNDVIPGLTGLAQVSGRDELEIADKAKLDGEYVKILKKGGIKAFLFDCRMIGCTVIAVLKHDGVVEGGTGVAARPIEPVRPEDAGFEDYGFRKEFRIDRTAEKKVLITGAGSYIGESFAGYCREHYPNIETDILDMKGDGWRSFDFSGYDSVFHVAGIAHADIGHATAEEQENYYRVNTDLAVETAKKAKDAGVRQFVFMSSMIIYGGQEYVDEHTLPRPANFYGNSKWLADKGIRELASDIFAVAVLRCPMIYGKGSKGNYPQLSKLARRLPVFPEVENRRSVLYIENLCEFVAQLSLAQVGGIYFPQNGEYASTSDIVSMIGTAAGKRVVLSRALNPAVGLARVFPVKKIRDLSGKAFGDLWYEESMSKYKDFEYQKVNLQDSIRRTEGE